jgi:hypothetical protein
MARGIVASIGKDSRVHRVSIASAFFISQRRQEVGTSKEVTLMSNAYTEVTKDQNNAVNRGVVPDHKVDGFNSQAAPVRPPQAAMFDKGASSLPEIQDACDQRREHSRQLSDPGARVGKSSRRIHEAASHRSGRAARA